MTNATKTAQEIVTAHVTAAVREYVRSISERSAIRQVETAVSNAFAEIEQSKASEQEPAFPSTRQELNRAELLLIRRAKAALREGEA